MKKLENMVVPFAPRARAGWPRSLDSIPTNVVGLLSPLIDICRVEELPPGEHRLVEWEDLEIGVFNCNGDLLAVEDRCSHDDGQLLEGDLDQTTCTIECPRHGSVFDLRTGKPLNLPAYVPIDTFEVSIEDGVIRVEVD
jgi:3-phenylpropionate/trans-cinnamate dioxygenase ferredoxin component